MEWNNGNITSRQIQTDPTREHKNIQTDLTPATDRTYASEEENSTLNSSMRSESLSLSVSSLSPTASYEDFGRVNVTKPKETKASLMRKKTLKMKQDNSDGGHLHCHYPKNKPSKPNVYVTKHHL